MSQSNIIALLVVGLIASNGVWVYALYRVVSELSSKIMAGTLDNYAENAPIIRPARREVVRPSLKDKSPKEESAFKDGAPPEYVDLDEMDPEKSLEMLKKFAAESGVDDVFEAEK